MTGNITEIMAANPYPGRGIICGLTSDGKQAVHAYFIMGRSKHSQNRVFVADGEEVHIIPYTESQAGHDLSLTIYRPVRRYADKLIVTNGDQTDTIYDYLAAGKTFTEALTSRTFEPDPPHYTPRISSQTVFDGAQLSYSLSILKSIDARGEQAARFFYDYQPVAGIGHFIHTYMGDKEVLPSFVGEPLDVDIPDDIDSFANAIWQGLNIHYRVALYVRYTDLATGEYTQRIFNIHDRID